MKAAPASPKTIDSKSIITLNLYVNLLQRASRGNLGYIHKLQGLELRASKELLKAGLLSESEAKSEKMISSVVYESILTPDGALALSNWSAYLKQESWPYKIGTALTRFLWIIAGALAASVTNIFEAAT